MKDRGGSLNIKTNEHDIHIDLSLHQWKYNNVTRNGEVNSKSTKHGCRGQNPLSF